MISYCVSFYFLSFILNISLVSKAEVNIDFSHVWGPGLHPNIVTLPARYFFIQAVDHNNNSFSSSLGKVFFANVEGRTKTSKPCRIWTNVLDRNDGSYIVRYKLYESCHYLKITVRYKDHHIGDSPYEFKGPIYSEYCDCPRGSVDNMLKTWGCKAQEQIDTDLSVFNEINWDKLRDEIIKHFDTPHSVSLCHYIIKNNKVYRKCYGKHVGFKMFIDSILLSLTRKAHLPDVEFFMNLGDWPLASHNLKEKYPIFSWCGSTDSYDIVMPTYDITQSSLESMGSVMLDIISVQGNVQHPWDQRVHKLFWRGRDSNRHRLDLIDISRRYPDLFNVSLTNFFFFRDEEHKYGPKTEYISFFKFFDYKYQLAIDGTVASYRLPYLLGGGSLVFKQDSKYHEHFYSQLKPNVHYIPLKKDLSDLQEKITWAIHHDGEARKIAKAGQNFVNENLLPDDILCYYVRLLHDFKKRIVSEVKVKDGMDEVESEQTENCICEKQIGDKKDEL